MAVSISATLIPCLKSFNQIQDLVKQPDYKHEEEVSSISWTDELGRLRVWASNIGAHQTGQSSLEFRLRDASHISQQITKLLKDLDGILDNVRDEISTDPVEASETTTLPDDEDTRPGEDPLSELQQLHEEIVNIVDCLYKMSMLIRRPAQHDLLIGSHKTDVAAFEPFDREHVRNKYHNADNIIIRRLGHAITERRRYLKYRERHRAKLGKGIESVQDSARTESALSETIATEFADQKIDFEENSSSSGVFQTSYAPSLMEGGSITMPPPPKESAAGKSFECPYCFFVIDVKGTRSWARHIFRDIKPYVCTFSDCRTPNRLYVSRREWSIHIRAKHSIEEPTCPLCKSTLASSKQFEPDVARHLEELALFALPRNPMDDESGQDDLDTGAPTIHTQSELDDSESSDEGVETNDEVIERVTEISSDGQDPDVLIMKHQGLTYPLHFPPFYIAEGHVKVGDLRRAAAKELKVDDPQRVGMYYTGRKLRKDRLACAEEGLKMNSEVYCFVRQSPLYR